MSFKRGGRIIISSTGQLYGRYYNNLSITVSNYKDCAMKENTIKQNKNKTMCR